MYKNKKTTTVTLHTGGVNGNLQEQFSWGGSRDGEIEYFKFNEN